MTSLPVGQDQITGMDVIELVDLEATGEHRHVPAEQIDEHALARLEHRGEHRILGETPAAFEYVQHGQTSALIAARRIAPDGSRRRSEEHTSELQSLMRISYAVFCLKKKTNKKDK